MEQADVLVIGAGAAGLMAAGTAAEAGARVILLEKMPRPGRKLAITGKGRCNLTNIEGDAVIADHFGNAAGTWLRPALDAFGAEALQAFMNRHGVPLVVERGGRVFPASGKAEDIVEALASWIARCGVILHPHCAARRLNVRDRRILGVETADGLITARAVILATGGASYPGTGSSGDGFRMAAGAGHRIQPPRPALVPLETSPRPVRALADLVLKNINVSLRVSGVEKASAFGELRFTPSGISGATVLKLSATAVEALEDGHETVIRIDLKPGLSHARLQARLARDLVARASESMQSLLRGLLPKPMIADCLDQTGIPPRQPARRLDPASRDRLIHWLKGLDFRISGHRGFSEAIITEGGIALPEVCPLTMASTIVSGLFLAGEVLDVAADTGGHNLQAAFSTGALAGVSAAAFSQDGSNSPHT